ncbi:MAG TPA: hypothetical protein VD968_09375 [Pyrinomonadaceae bacterium]|nr:hypothetical protein [Pyrinomonadaceae bacterium]
MSGKVKPFYGTGEFAVAEFAPRKAAEVIEMLLTAFDCTVPDDAGRYCSSDVTTGRRLYFHVFEEHGVRSSDEMKAKLGRERYREVKAALIRHNIERGVRFTESLRRRGLANLINPGPLVAPGFDQEHYHYLWECVIIKKVCETHFNEGWEYSNGCTLEYAVSRRKGIPCYDHRGGPLPPAEAVEKIKRALDELKERGIAVPALERNLKLITDQG